MEVYRSPHRITIEDSTHKNHYSLFTHHHVQTNNSTPPPRQGTEGYWGAGLRCRPSRRGGQTALRSRFVQNKLPQRWGKNAYILLLMPQNILATSNLQLMILSALTSNKKFHVFLSKSIQESQWLVQWGCVQVSGRKSFRLASQFQY